MFEARKKDLCRTEHPVATIPNNDFRDVSIRSNMEPNESIGSNQSLGLDFPIVADLADAQEMR